MFGLFDWLQTQPPSISQFVGSLTGSGIGLMALLAGALFNAHLNRRRDDRLRKIATTSLAVSLVAELANLEHSLRSNIPLLREPQGAFMSPDIAHGLRILPEIVTKLDGFDQVTISHLMETYIVVDQYCETMIMMGGSLMPNLPRGRVVITMPEAQAANVITIDTNLAERIAATIVRLKPYTLLR